MGLTALDIIVLLLVGGGLIFGWLRGFVHEILSLLAWVAAIITLKFAHAPVSALLANWVGTAGGAAVLAFALIFLIVFVVVKLIARRAGGATRQSVIGPIDRILGGGFGALKGLIGATLLYLLASLIYNTAFGRAADRPAWMTESRTYPLLNASSRAIVDFVKARQETPAEDGDATTQDDETLQNAA